MSKWLGVFFLVTTAIFCISPLYADSVYVENDKLKELELRIENLELRLEKSKEHVVVVGGAKMYQATSSCEELVPMMLKELRANGETYRSPIFLGLIERKKYEYVDSGVQVVVSKSQTVRLLKSFNCVEEQGHSFYLVSPEGGTDVWAILKSDTIEID